MFYPSSAPVLCSRVVCKGSECGAWYSSHLFLSHLQSMRSMNRTYSTSVKTEELELGENGRAQLFNNSSSSTIGNGSNHVPPSHTSASSYSGLDYLLLAAVIDRLCLVIFMVIFIINMLTYNGVL